MRVCRLSNFHFSTWELSTHPGDLHSTQASKTHSPSIIIKRQTPASINSNRQNSPRLVVRGAAGQIVGVFDLFLVHLLDLHALLHLREIGILEHRLLDLPVMHLDHQLRDQPLVVGVGGLGLGKLSLQARDLLVFLIYIVVSAAAISAMRAIEWQLPSGDGAACVVTVGSGSESAGREKNESLAISAPETGSGGSGSSMVVVRVVFSS